jgi:site-specific recombinase XerD
MVLRYNKSRNELGVLHPRIQKGGIPPSGQTFIMEAFYEMTCDRRFQPSTIESYKYDTKHFIRFLEHKGVPTYLEVVTSQLAQEWVNAQIEKGYSANTIRKRVMALMTLYKFSMEQDLIKSNPFMRIRLPYVEPYERPNLLSFDEVIHIMRVVKSLKEEGVDIEIVVRMMLFSGLKPSQLMSIKVKDVTFESGMIRSQKCHRYEVKPIPPLLYQQIQETIVHKGLKEDDLLLRGLSGLPIRPQQLHRINQKLSDQIGKTGHRITVQSMRVSMALHLYLRGLDPYMASYFLGLKPPDNSLPFISELIKVKQESLIHALTLVEKEIEEGTKANKETNSKVVHFRKMTLPK